MTTALTLPADKFDPNLTFVRPDPTPTRAPLDKLAVLPGFNTRVKDDEYRERVIGITQSIIQQGFYEDKPFSVVMLPGDDTVYIFDGEHRFDAAKAAILDGAEFPDGLPIAFAKDGATVRDLTIHLVHGNAGERLNQVELAAVVRRLKNLGLDKDEIAKEIGKTPRHVDNLLVLAGAGAAVKKAVAAGQIAAAEAVKLVRKDPAKAAETIQAAVKAAEERGKAKATPKTMQADAPPPTPMRAIPFEHVADAGTVMGDLLKTVAGQVRGAVQIGDGDKLTEGFTLKVIVSVVDHEAVAARAKRAEEREAARIEREKAAAARLAEREAKAKEREKAAKAKAAEKEKARKAKEAEKAKAAKAKAAEKAAKAKAAEKAKAEAAKKLADATKAKEAAAAKAASAQGPKSAAQAKANAKAHLGTDKQAETPASKAATGKAASGGKAAGASQTPAEGDSGAKGADGALAGDPGAGGASQAADDANRGL